VYPWQEIVSGHVRTEVAFERAFNSHAIAQFILFGAFLSLLKIFNGNFVASTRMLYAMGRRNIVHPSLGRVHAVFGTPVVAILLMATLTVAGSMFGDAILVPITEVGSLAVGVGWLSACVAYLARRRRDNYVNESATLAWMGAAVSGAIILMKVVPSVPGSFTRTEWMAFAAWSAAGAGFWMARRRNYSLEQVIERPAGARLPLAAVFGGRCDGAGLTLDRRARGKERAEVARVLGRHARGERLRALPARAGVERGALHAAVEVHTATRARTVGADLEREAMAAPRAAEHLVRRHQVRGFRAGRILQETSRRALFRRPRRRRSLRPAWLRLVLITTLSILAI
jgi:hypothetical protein